ncbi:unnamed protein product, partial [Pocillopora meandrina]
DLCKDYQVEIPQCKPLSPGEILGCTASRIKHKDAFISYHLGTCHRPQQIRSLQQSVFQGILRY